MMLFRHLFSIGSVPLFTENADFIYNLHCFCDIGPTLVLTIISFYVNVYMNCFINTACSTFGLCILINKKNNKKTSPNRDTNEPLGPAGVEGGGGHKALRYHKLQQSVI